jgi:hypothetical protein
MTGGFRGGRGEGLAGLSLAWVTTLCICRANFEEFSFFYLVSPEVNTGEGKAQLYVRTEVVQN